MRIILIAAVADNGVIGRQGDLPWRIPDDLKRFKRLTMGRPVVMGRKTFESIGRALPGRPNIVVTRRPDFAAPGVTVVRSVDEALERAAEMARRDGVDEIMVIGGGEIYAETLPRADRLDLTEVHATPEGDAYFPAFDRGAWREVERSEHETEAGLRYSFAVYDRRDSNL